MSPVSEKNVALLKHVSEGDIKATKTHGDFEIYTLDRVAAMEGDDDDDDGDDGTYDYAPAA